jgi:NADH dehydrogenase (ubiquinone) 1 beta subcomplex subunit 6
MGGDGKQSKEVSKILARASMAKMSEYPKWPASETGGVMPMNIEGRFANERARLGPDFTDAERQWRIKWIKDQVLHPSEPRHVPELYIEYNNPIRRFYQKPLNWVEQNVFRPRMGAEGAWTARKLMATAGIVYMFSLYSWYYLKYNQSGWEKMYGFNVTTNRRGVYPGDPAYPSGHPRPNHDDYADKGFKSRKSHWGY